MYRTRDRTPRGQVFCVPWPEWHVECAHEACGEGALVSAIGMAHTVKEANKFADKNDEKCLTDWRKKDGLWYCPKHT